MPIMPQAMAATHYKYIHLIRLIIQCPSHLEGWQHLRLGTSQDAHHASRGGNAKRQHIAPIAPQGAAALSISKRIQLGTKSLDLVLPAPDNIVRLPISSLTISLQ